MGLTLSAMLWAGPTGGRAWATDGPGGLIALPRGRDIALIKPDGSEERTIVSLQLGEFVADVALSPDGTRIAFGMFTSRTGGGPGGSDIVVVPVASSSERTVVVPRDRPGMLLAAPQWSPDGTALVFESVGLSTTGQASVSAEWVSADGTGRRTIAQSARYPSFSSDGQRVVYTKAMPTGDSLWEQPVDGSEGRQILPDSVFLLITYPRYSPDGGVIALTGVVDAVPGAAGIPKLLPGGPSGDPAWPREVAAHGFPTEPFTVSPSGGDLKRLAQLPIDDGALAWSPDGAWVGMSGANGLFLVSVADGSVRRASENGSFGAIDWR